MKWPWLKSEADVDAAKKAVQAAVADRPRVHAVALRARELKQRNGFGEAIQRAMGLR